jgi:hypothetical protein
MHRWRLKRREAKTVVDLFTEDGNIVIRRTARIRDIRRLLEVLNKSNFRARQVSPLALKVVFSGEVDPTPILEWLVKQHSGLIICEPGVVKGLASCNALENIKIVTNDLDEYSAEYCRKMFVTPREGREYNEEFLNSLILKDLSLISCRCDVTFEDAPLVYNHEWSVRQQRIPVEKLPGQLNPFPVVETIKSDNGRSYTEDRVITSLLTGGMITEIKGHVSSFVELSYFRSVRQK